MSMMMVTKQAATLSAGHPLVQILVTQPVPDAADPVAGAQAQVMGALLLAGFQDYDTSQAVSGGTQGLTAAGVAAVAAQFNTYLGGLSAAKKAQTGFTRAQVTSAGFALTVHVTDIAAQATALQTILNTAANFGAVGT